MHGHKRAAGAMPGLAVAVFRCGRPEIGHDEYANSCSQRRVRSFARGHSAAKIMHGSMFAPANLAKAGPHVGLKANAGAVIADSDIAAYEAAPDRGGNRILCFERTGACGGTVESWAHDFLRMRVQHMIMQSWVDIMMYTQRYIN